MAKHRITRTTARIAIGESAEVEIPGTAAIQTVVPYNEGRVEIIFISPVVAEDDADISS